MNSTDENNNNAPYMLHEELCELQITCITAIDCYLYLTTNTELKLYVDLVNADAFRNVSSNNTTQPNKTTKNSSTPHSVNSATKQQQQRRSPLLRRKHNAKRGSRRRKPSSNLHQSSSSGFSSPSSPVNGDGKLSEVITPVASATPSATGGGEVVGLKNIANVTLSSTQCSFWHLSARPWHHHQETDASSRRQHQNSDSTSSAAHANQQRLQLNHLTPPSKDINGHQRQTHNRTTNISSKLGKTPIQAPLQQSNCECHLVVVACSRPELIHILLAHLDDGVEQQFLLPLFVLGEGTFISFALSRQQVSVSGASPPTTIAATAKEKKERFSVNDVVQITISAHGSYIAAYHGYKKDQYSTQQCTTSVADGEKAATKLPSSSVHSTQQGIPTEAAGFGEMRGSMSTHSLSVRNNTSQPPGMYDSSANARNNPPSTSPSPSDSAYCIEIFESPRIEWNGEHSKYYAYLGATKSLGNLTLMTEKCNKIAHQLRTTVPSPGSSGSVGSASTGVLEKPSRKPLLAVGTSANAAPSYNLIQFPPTLLFRIRSPYASLINIPHVILSLNSTKNTPTSTTTPGSNGAIPEHSRRNQAIGGPRNQILKNSLKCSTPSPTVGESDNKSHCGSIVKRVLASLSETVVMPLATQEAMEQNFIRAGVNVSSETVQQWETNCLPTIHFITRNAVVYANKLSGLQRKAVPPPTGTDSLVMRWTGSCQVQHYALRLLEHGVQSARPGPLPLPQQSPPSESNPVRRSVEAGRSVELSDAEISGAKGVSIDVVTNGSATTGDNGNCDSEECERRQRLQQLIRPPSRCWNYCHTVTSSAVGPEGFILAVGLDNGVVVTWNLAQALPIYQVLAFSGAIRQLLISTPHGSTHPTSPAETLQFHVLVVGATSSHAPTPVAAENANSDGQKRKVVEADDALLEPAVKLIDSHGHGSATLRIVMPHDKVTDDFALSRLQPLAIGRLGTSRFVVAWNNGLVHTWHRDSIGEDRSGGVDEMWTIEHVEYQPQAFGLAVLKNKKKRQTLQHFDEPRNASENDENKVVQHALVATHHRLYVCNRLAQTAKPQTALNSRHYSNNDEIGDVVDKYSSVAVLRSRDLLGRIDLSEPAKLFAGGLGEDNTESHSKLLRDCASANRLSNLKRSTESTAAVAKPTKGSGDSAQHLLLLPNAKKLSISFADSSTTAALMLLQQQLKNKFETRALLENDQEQHHDILPPASGAISSGG